MAQPQRKMTPDEEKSWFKVRVALKIDPLTSDFYKEIKIHVNRNEVTLDGSVPTEEAAQQAVKVVGAVPDVVNVVNNLKVG